MNNTIYLIAHLTVAIALLYFLYRLQKRQISFGLRILSGLGLGIVFGAALQFVWGSGSPLIGQTTRWFDIVGVGYVRLLKLLVMPLVLVSISTAIIQIKNIQLLSKTGSLIIGLLLFTTAIAGAIGAGSALAFDLNAASLSAGEAQLGATKNLETTFDKFQTKPLQLQLIEIIPTNLFQALTGQNSTDTLSVVLLAALLGIIILKLQEHSPKIGAFLTQSIEAAHAAVLQLVDFVLALSPYGVLMLMTKFIAASNPTEIFKLVQFVTASYVALLAMFVVHLLLVYLGGMTPLSYLEKTVPALAFAFTSRTSAGTLPLTVEAMTKKLGISEGTANLAASLGTSIGQNGCAGIYPAMLAVMIAPSVGINPLDPLFLLKLIAVVALSSFGIAGVGGGATFAALLVLSTLGLPVGLVGLLIAIEPLIDMGRTALNVSGAITVGWLVERFERSNRKASAVQSSASNLPTAS